MPITNATAAAALGAIVDRIALGAGAGKLKLYTANYALLLAVLTLNDPPFGTPTEASPSVSTLVVSPEITTSGLADGTAAAFQFTDSNDLVHWQETGSGAVGTSNALVIVSTTAIEVGQQLKVISCTLSFPTAFANLS
jgi:hypothetical protein